MPVNHDILPLDAMARALESANMSVSQTTDGLVGRQGKVTVHIAISPPEAGAEETGSIRAIVTIKSELPAELAELLEKPGGLATFGRYAKVARDDGRLRERIEECRRQFVEQVERCPRHILDYVTTVVTALNSANVRISPRRSRLMARSLLAATLVKGAFQEKATRMVLECSLPHATWGAEVAKSVVDAAHRLAWEAAMKAEARWVDQIFAEAKLDRKLEVLLKHCPSPDEGTQAVAQIIAAEPKSRAAAFAFAVYPAAALGKLPIGTEGANDLGRLASPVLSVDAEVTWTERGSVQAPHHPAYDAFSRVLVSLTGARAERARQFFSWCLVEQVTVSDPAALEKEIEACAKILKRMVK